MTDCEVIEQPDTAFPPDIDAVTAGRRRATLWLVAGGMFMAVLDATIVNVTLPAMSADLDVTVAGLAWIVDAYTLSMAALILAGGLLADRWGAKRIYLFGMALFVAASALCGAAPSVAILIGARFAQGMGAALFLPASLAVVRGAFDDPSERGGAIATWALIASLAAAVGPVAGGLLVDGFGWRSVFFVNVPTGLVAFVLTALIVRARPISGTKPFDWAGQTASIAMLGALCFAAIEMPEQGLYSVSIGLAIVITFAAAAAFVWIERRARDPMVPLGWFRNPIFVSANLIGCLVYVGYFGTLFILSLYLHGAYRLDGRATGLALLPVAASLSVGNMLAGGLQARISPRLIIAASLAFAGVSAPLVAVLLVGHAPWSAIVGALAVFGAGTSASVPPVISTVLTQVPETASGVASGLLNALRQLGSLLGVAAASAASTLAPHLPVALWIVAIMAGVAYIAAALVALIGMLPQNSHP